MTPKGIYFTLKYYYEVQKGDRDKALGGIGIVPSIYKEATAYWVELNSRKEGTIEAIVEQIQARATREFVPIRRKEEKKDKARYKLEDI